MQKLAVWLSNYLQRKLNKQQGQQEQLNRHIELLNGEAVNLKGMTSSQIKNKINTRIPFWIILYEFIQRPGNLIFLIINVICYSIIDEKQEDEYPVLYEFILPLFANLFAYLIQVYYFEYQKYLQDYEINNRKVTIFSKLKQLNPKKTNPTEQEPKNDLKFLSTEQPPKNDIILTCQPVKTDLKQPIVGSFQIQAEKSKFCMKQNHNNLPAQQQQQQQQQLQDQKISIFDTVKWEDLEVGDIIVVQKNEICPADILILESSQEKCFANSMNFTGNTTDLGKTANILTSVPKQHSFKGNSFEYRSMMSGNITYDKINKDIQVPIFGFIKLKNDPQSIDFKKDNMLFREQMLLSCDYIYGLILYAGKNCKYYYHIPIKRESKSFFIGKLDRFYEFSILIIVFISFLSWMIDSLQHQEKNWKIEQLAFLFLIYLNFIPHYIYFALDLYILGNAIYKKYQFQQIKQISNNHIILANFKQNDHIEMKRYYKQINNTPLADLSLIDSAIFDKTGTITIPKFKLKMLFINDQLFQVNHKTFRNVQDWKGYQKEVLENIQMQNIEEESESFQKQISSIKVSPVNKPMSPSKRTSLIPWKLEDKLINCDQEYNDQNEVEQFGETSNQDEANFNPKDFADDHLKLSEVHRSTVPKVFQQDMWTSQFDFNQTIVIQGEQKRQSPIRKGSERPAILTDRSAGRKKMSAERNFPKTIQIDDWRNDEELIFDEKGIFLKMTNPEFKQHFQESLLVLTICHNSTSKYVKSEDLFKHEQSSHIDHLQTQFAAQYNYKFICATQNKTKYVLEVMDEFIEVPITVTRMGNYRLSVIKQAPQETQGLDFSSNEEEQHYIQYIREDGLDLSNMIIVDKEEKEGWDNLIFKFQSKGCRPVVFYKSYLTSKEYHDFLKYPETVFYNKARNFEIILIIGIAEKLRKKINHVVKCFNEAEISMWMASGDTLEKVLPVAYKTQILRQKTPIINIEEGDVREQIQQAIQNLYNNQIKSLKDNSPEKPTLERQPSPNPANRRKSVLVGRRQSTRDILPGMVVNQSQKLNPIAVLVNGSALEQIDQDLNTFNHLAFLISFSYTVIGYKMNKHQKGLLVKILQKRQVWGRRVLVVGDEWCDSQMMSHSNYCMQFKNKRIFQQNYIERVEMLPRLKRERQSSKPINLMDKQKISVPREKYLYSESPIISVCDMVIKEFDDLIALIFFESRVQAEFLDNLIIFSFYRNYLITFWVFFQLTFKNIDYYPPFHYHQSIIFYMGTILLGCFTKPSGQNQTPVWEQLVYFYNQNQIDFRKSRYQQYFYKVLFYPIFESLILTLLQINVEYQFLDGYFFDQSQLQFQSYLIILMIELTKLVHFANTIQTTLIIVIYLLFGMISYLKYFKSLKHQFVFLLSSQSIFFIILIVVITYMIHKMLTINWNFIVKGRIFSQFEKDDIKHKKHSVVIYYHKKNTELYSLFNHISKFVLKLFTNEEEIDPTIRQMLSGMALSEKTKKIHKYTQQFENPQLENKYQISQLPQIMEYYRYYYPLSWMLVEGALLVQLWVNSSTQDYSWLLYSSFSYNGIQIMIALIIYTAAFKKYHFRISKLLIFSRLLYKIIYDIYFFQNNNNNFNDMLIMQLFMLQPLIDDRPLIIILYCVIIAISFIVRFSSNNTSINVNINNYIMLNYYLIAIMQCALSCGMHAKFQRSYRENYIQTYNLSQLTNQKQDTFNILMPKFIRTIINQKGESDISENQGEVAIIFCDICQFDTIIKIQQQNVIILLDQLFRQYDSLCNQYSLQKIETVGKTYMAAAGLKHITAQSIVNPVLRAIKVAFEMKKFAATLNLGQTEGLTVKIGVHYGNVIAGVIGLHKPQFSLIGDTINTTSRICSTGQDGQIKISEQAFKQVFQQTEYIFTQCEVEAKGKGVLITYIISQQQKNGNKLRKLQKYREQSSQKLIYPKHGHQDEIVKQKRSIFEFRGSKKPSLIVPSIKIMQGQQGSHIQHRSSMNLEKETPKNSHGESEQAAGGRTLDGQNVIDALEFKLQKDNLLFDEFPDYPLYEFDREKIKLLHQSDNDEFKEVDIIILDKRKLYLDFDPEVDEEVIEAFYEQLALQNIILIIFLQVSVSVLILIYNSSTFFIIIAFLNYPLWLFNLVYGYIIVAVTIIFSILLATKSTSEKFCKQKYFIISYLITIIWWIIHIFSTDENIVGENLVALGIFLSFLTQLNPIIQMKYKGIESFCLILINLIVIIVKEWDLLLIYYAILLQIIFITNQFYKFYNNVQTYNSKCKLEQKHAQLDQLTKHQLPTHMLNQFLKSQTQKTVVKDNHNNVTLLFADIAGFTEYSDKVAPEQVVNMLRTLFTEFDKYCQMKNVYKLYTIGDCYVVMGMMDSNDRNEALEAKNVVEMGFEMINIIKRVRTYINFDKLDMRIGVHTGKIIGGVLGTDIVRYDIYGPDVLIANKMESKGEKGQVQVSSTTKEILEMCYAEEFQYVYNQSIEFPSIDRKTEGFFISIKTEYEPSIDLQNQDSI